MKRVSLLACLVVFLMIPASSYALLGIVELEAAVGAWYVAPSGEMEYKSPSYDIEDVFGFEEEVPFMGRIRVELPIIPNIYVMATPMEFEGKAGSAFEFNGESFPVDADTRLTFNQYDVALYYGVPFLGLASLGTLSVDAGLNVRVIELEAEMSNGSTRESVDMTVPLPMLYVAAGFSPIDLIELEAEVRGLSVGYGSMISAIARVNVNCFGPLYVSGGYRFEDMSIDKDDFEADLRFSGPFAEVGLEF